ncbi:MAG TPA: histidine phosphatase family protein [Bacteroidales bacterium]|jgi:uncharacterized phosphatase|nr:histidine phosphatase family protein [Bacteroidales bacterium]
MSSTEVIFGNFAAFIHFMDTTNGTLICLIRHGETDWNASGRLQGREDIELNNAGRQQAILLAGYLQKSEWDLIISSPLKRACESARIIASQLSIPDPVIINQLHERDYGEASGMLPEERRSRFPDGKFPGQEDFEDLRKRAMATISEIATRYAGKRIIVISHGAWINSVLYTLSSSEFGSFKTRLKNACINLLNFSGNTWHVIFYNKTADELA